jgi:hypothetical protein
VFAQLTIIVLTPVAQWNGSDDYPPVRERLRLVLDQAVEPLPSWFWNSVVSILTAFARGLRSLPHLRGAGALDG